MNHPRLLCAAAGLLAGMLLTAAADAASSIERAFETSQKTGRPILAVVGADT